VCARRNSVAPRCSEISTGVIDDTFSHILSNTYGFSSRNWRGRSPTPVRMVAPRGHIAFNNLALAKYELAAIILGSSVRTRLTNMAGLTFSVAGSFISRLLNTAPMRFRHGQPDGGTRGAVSVGAMSPACSGATKILTVL